MAVLKYLANVLHSDPYGDRAMKYSDLVENEATDTEKQEFLAGGDMSAATIRIPKNLRDAGKEAATFKVSASAPSSACA